MIEASLSNVNVCMPGKIVKYDAQTQYADVQPILQSRRENGVLFTRAVIPNVPVKHPRASGGSAFVHMPIKAGDDVLLVFAQRSIDNWKTKGGVTDPADRRKFNFSDAIALIGCSALPDSFTVNDPDSIEIVNESGKLQVKADGTINIGDYAPAKSVALGEAVEARLSAIESKVTSLATASISHTHNVVALGSPTGPPTPPGTPFIADTSVVSSAKAKVVP